MTGSVSPARAVGLTHRLLLRQLLTRGRVIALLLLGGVTILAAVGVAVSDDVDDAAVTTIEIIDGLGLVLVVPIVSLVFASASLGDGREDGTLVYLWLRPMDRLPVVVGAYLASLTISLPLTVAPLGAAAAVGGAGADGITATVIASVIGVVAYSALFVLLGLLVKNSIIWGLAYVLLWEGLFTQFSEAIGQAAVRGYLRAVLADLSDVSLSDALDVSTATAVIVAAGVMVGSIAIAAMRLERMEID
ncbi:MAG: hypothetical protein ACPHIC_09635 [Acidimicrobiales bacterium]|jgi:ABC-2 type transport system permease protein